jgi:bifunctional non-homologous end joining protein LigD
MVLADYRRRRKFTATPEPVGRARQRSKRIFVVQKHAASRLHYDFRLAIHGVLVSWAVPKGPSMDPADKHLAIRTEDHPLEYAKFEGVIPEGQYGAGTVMVWDAGPYNSMNDTHTPEQLLVQGKIDIELGGIKLRGGFTLVRTDKSSSVSSGRERWLLIKRRDAYADRSWNIDDPRLDYSALTGRTLKQIERGEPIKAHTNAHAIV